MNYELRSQSFCNSTSIFYQFLAEPLVMVGRTSWESLHYVIHSNTVLITLYTFVKYFVSIILKLNSLYYYV